MLKRNAKSKILSLCIFAAMLLFVIGILYFGYLMVMRAQWKGLKNDIADAINAAPFKSDIQNRRRSLAL